MSVSVFMIHSFLNKYIYYIISAWELARKECDRNRGEDMASVKERSVEYSRISGDIHVLNMKSDSMPDITIDWSDIPRNQRGGNSTRMLAAACLNCFAGTFADAMTARGAELISLAGRADLHTSKDEKGRTRISSIQISVEVEIEDRYKKVLEKCIKIMERGCLVTYSLEGAIPVRYTIERISGS
jgi:osmotically inducible protein OsmC